MTESELHSYRETLLDAIRMTEERIDQRQKVILDVAGNEQRRAQQRIIDRQAIEEIEEQMEVEETKLSSYRRRLRNFGQAHPDIQSPSHEEE